MPKTITETILPVLLLYTSLMLGCGNTWGQPYEHRLNHLGSELKIQLSEDFSPKMHKELLGWTEYISNALLQVYGRWPRREWEISVWPVSASHSNPIPWAQVKRGEPDRVEFFTSATSSTRELKAAWTSYHELSHLLIPYRGWGDLWFSEGLATYYQNVLQLRIGQLSEQAMWQRIYEGFMRGRAQSEFSAVDLQTLSGEMRDTGAYMRVYWSGAWYFLNADLKLRQLSGGARSLDSALEQLNRCCANQKMSVPQMVRKLDSLNRLVLFEPLYRELVSSRKTPPFEPLFTSMGISITDKKVKLQSTGPGATLRSQIGAPKSL